MSTKKAVKPKNCVVVGSVDEVEILYNTETEKFSANVGGTTVEAATRARLVKEINRLKSATPAIVISGIKPRSVLIVGKTDKQFVLSGGSPMSLKNKVFAYDQEAFDKLVSFESKIAEITAKANADIEAINDEGEAVFQTLTPLEVDSLPTVQRRAKKGEEEAEEDQPEEDSPPPEITEDFVDTNDGEKTEEIPDDEDDE